MDLEPLEAFAADYALNLAGWTLNSNTPGLVPLDARQLTVTMIAAVSAYATRRPDYNSMQDITDVIRFGVIVYGKATEANISAALEELDAAENEGPPLEENHQEMPEPDEGLAKQTETVTLKINLSFDVV